MLLDVSITLQAFAAEQVQFETELEIIRVLDAELLLKRLKIISYSRIPLNATNEFGS